MTEWRDAFTAVMIVDGQDRGIRGFVVDLLAFIPIAIVIGTYGWTAWPNGDLRDTISAWFAFSGRLAS